MSISRNLFNEIRKKHGDSSSWAIWQEPDLERVKYKLSFETTNKLRIMGIEAPFDILGTGTSSGMKDDIFQDVSDEVLNQLNPKYILVALNFSKPCKKCGEPSVLNEQCDNHKVVETLMNFHSGDGNIGKLRYAVRKSPLSGAYITDIIKNLPNAKSKEVIKKCRNDPSFEKENVDLFIEEISDLKVENQVIIALGEYVGEILTRHNIKHTKIAHYSSRYSCGQGLVGLEYKKGVLKILVHELGFQPW